MAGDTPTGSHFDVVVSTVLAVCSTVSSLNKSVGCMIEATAAVYPVAESDECSTTAEGRVAAQFLDFIVREGRGW